MEEKIMNLKTIVGVEKLQFRNDYNQIVSGVMVYYLEENVDDRRVLESEGQRYGSKFISGERPDNVFVGRQFTKFLSEESKYGNKVYHKTIGIL